MSTVAFDCCGARILLSSADRRLLQDLMPLLPPGSVVVRPENADTTFFIRKSPNRNLYSILQDSHNIARKGFVYRTLEELASEFHFAVSVFARPYLFVHAGVVAWRGHAIVLPGRSMSGKSTLVSALVDHGATYYSDEYAVIDRHGRIHPYRKPLTLRSPGETHRRFESLPVSGAKRHSKAIAAGLVAFLSYKSNSHWNPDRMTPAEAVLALFKNTIAAQTRPRFAVRALSHLARCAPSIRGFRPDAGIIAPSLVDFVSEYSGSQGRSTPDLNSNAEYRSHS
jgi:hypothetical protein